jgi:hypothetical protein
MGLYLSINPPQLRTVAFLFVLVFLQQTGYSQLQISVDTTDPGIKNAVVFLSGYLDEFKNRKYPDYKKYWSQADLEHRRVPDDIVHAISSDVVTYNFSIKPLIFYAKEENNYVHLKAIFPDIDSQGLEIMAITNHYISGNNMKHYFISEMELHKDNYRTVQFSNISYHFPSTHKFDKKKAVDLQLRLRPILRSWNFEPKAIDYYFADSRTELEKMRGLDYCLGMDGTAPSGISFVETNTVFCQGLGENYLHEVLHLYFNPIYQNSTPLCHGLVYYLAGGTGYDFNWMIERLRKYLETYPETNLRNFEELQTKDKYLHIDNVVAGIFCKLVDQKEGVPGLKRLLAFKSVDEMLIKEFGITRDGLDGFIRKKLDEFRN